MCNATLTPEVTTVSNPAGGSQRDTALALSCFARLLAHYGTRDFTIRLWNGTTVPPDPGQEARFTLILNRPRAVRRMLLPPNELALAEAYLDKDFDLEGDIVAAMRLGDVFEKLGIGIGDSLRLVRQAVALPNEASGNGGNGHGVEAVGRQRARLDGVEHSRERDRKAVTYHYDVGNDFFRLFLDRRMVYSCAYFPTGQEDLDTAQEAKLEHTCRKLRLKPGDRLLDIGCGWGGLILYSVEKYGVEALGITLSQPQAELANQRIGAAGLSERCRAVVLDYRDLTGQQTFDKIASVGMVEHVGRGKLHEYFESAWRALKPGGLFLNHGITAAGRDVGASNLLDRYVFQRGAFVRKYVFPDGELIPLGDVLGIAERVGFEIRDVESLREHYALTLRHWLRRLEANREEAIRQADERTHRVWRLYMAACSHAFTTARLSVHQSLLAKPDAAGQCDLPMNRADLYGCESPVAGSPRSSSSHLLLDRSWKLEYAMAK